MTRTLVIPRPLLALAIAHAERAYPEEACGGFLGAEGVARSAVEIRNALEGTPAARCAFAMDVRELLACVSEAGARGESLLAVYHSHVDSPAVFSSADLASALTPDKAPWWPGAEQVVLSVVRGRVREVRRYAWNGSGFEVRRDHGS